MVLNKFNKDAQLNEYNRIKLIIKNTFAKKMQLTRNNFKLYFYNVCEKEYFEILEIDKLDDDNIKNLFFI